MNFVLKSDIANMFRQIIDLLLFDALLFELLFLVAKVAQ